MQTGFPDRRLAAVMLADLVGYSRMVAEDEAGTIRRVSALMGETVRPIIARHRGRLVKGTGDGFLAEFPSAVEAVACAAALQQAMAGPAAAEREGRRLLFRIGVNLGDIIAGEDGDIYGDGVNIAARLEPLSEPGGIAISGKVLAEVRGRLTLAWEDGGERALKNIPEPVRVFLHRPGATAAGAARPGRALIAVLPFRGPPELAPGLGWLTAGAIARVPRLAVLSTAAADSLAASPVTLRQEAARLGLRAVLEADVRDAAAGITITALLHDPARGDHLLAWSDSAADAEAAALPGRLATAIAERAHAPGLAVAPPTRSATALRALLRGLGASAQEEAIAAWEDAAAEDPGCALAQALLAHAYAARVEIDPGALRDAESLALRALPLDPQEARPLARAAAALARAGHPEAGPTARLAAAVGDGDGEAKAKANPAAAGLSG
jgi:class 3 adenylate cyclase